jgi:hypothetical protein
MTYSEDASGFLVYILLPCSTCGTLARCSASNCLCALIEPFEAWLIVEAAALSLATDYA